MSSQRSRGGLDEVNILMLPKTYMLCGPGHSNSVPFPRTLIAKTEQTVCSNEDKAEVALFRGTYLYFGFDVI